MWCVEQIFLDERSSWNKYYTLKAGPRMFCTVSYQVQKSVHSSFHGEIGTALNPGRFVVLGWQNMALICDSSTVFFWKKQPWHLVLCVICFSVAGPFQVEQKLLALKEKGDCLAGLSLLKSGFIVLFVCALGKLMLTIFEGWYSLTNTLLFFFVDLGFV